jgi:phosphoglycerate kinase
MNLNNKQIPFIKDIDLTNKTCVVRLDLNVPIKNGEITDSSRIIAAKKTIDYLLNNNCKLVILSHLSRIKTADDITSGKKSLALIAKKLKEIFPKNKISFVANNIDKTLPKKIKSMHFKEILLLENTRYQDFDIKTQKLVKLESKNDSKLAKF